MPFKPSRRVFAAIAIVSTTAARPAAPVAAWAPDATTGIAALGHGRSFVGIEPVAANVAMSIERIRTTFPLLATAERVA